MPSNRGARRSASRRSSSKKTADLPVLPAKIDARRERRGARGTKRAAGDARKAGQGQTPKGLKRSHASG